MQLFDSPTMASLLEASRATAAFDGEAWANTQAEGGSPEGWHVAWLTFKNLEQSVRDDVIRIRNHALTPKDVPVWGFIYDVKSGQLLPVE
jgi:carbonic anhydrase